jgi:transcriptional regulator NrdR family protein
VDCPQCKEFKTSVLDTRKFFDPDIELDFIRRYRCCTDADCAHRFYTIELEYERFVQYQQQHQQQQET